MASDAAHSKDDVLMKRISDLHFKLFSSMKKKTKTMKVWKCDKILLSFLLNLKRYLFHTMLSLFRQAAVFETQCCASGCTFNSYKAGVPRVCNGQLLTQLNEIQSSINNIWKRKPIGLCMNIWVFFLLFWYPLCTLHLIFHSYNVKNYVTNSLLNAFVWIQTACKHGWKRYGDHCYHLFSAKMNWFEAQVNT